jgi:hypothetical protein
VYEYVCIKLRTTFLSRSVLKSVRYASCDAMKFRTSMLVRIQTRVYLQPSSQSLSRSVLYREGHHTFRVQSLIHFHLRKMMLVCAPQHQTHCSVGPFCILGHHTSVFNLSATSRKTMLVCTSTHPKPDTFLSRSILSRSVLYLGGHHTFRVQSLIHSICER